jgi:hypothetical protein
MLTMRKIAALLATSVMSGSSLVVPAIASAPSVDDVYARIAIRGHRKLFERACVFSTFRADHHRKHNYLLVDFGRDLAAARRLARAAGPARMTTVATNPARYHSRAMRKI